MKKASRVVWKMVRLAFWVIVLYCLSLAFHQQELPYSWLVRICDGLSTTNVVFHCEGLSFGLRHGVQARGIRVFDTTRKDSLRPVFSAGSVSVFPFARRVRVVDARFPRLGDAYYDGTASYASGPVPFPTLKDLPNFTLEVVRGEILGIVPERVTADVKVSPRSVAFHRIALDWPDRDHPMHLDGWCEIDFDGQKVRGEVHGQATQAQIRPFLVALDVPVAYPYMDAFTQVQGPVRASCAWDVDVTEPGFKLDLDLHPVMGRYNGVSFKSADGQLALDIHLPNGKFEYDTRIGPIRATDRAGGELAGSVTVRKTNDVFSVLFDTTTSLAFKDALDVLGYFNDGLLDCIVCETPPRFTCSGVYYPYVPHTKRTDLKGHFSVLRGSILGMPLFDVASDWGMTGETLFFANAAAHGRAGGTLSGGAEITIPDLDGRRAAMHVNFRYGNGTVPEIAEFLGMDSEGRTGRVEGAIDLTFPLATNALARMNGRGEIRIRDGQVTQTRLFAGLTRILAEKVPGIGAVVNQTDCTGAFEIRDGVLRFANLRIEGTVFSIVASGTCDFSTGALDCLCRLTFMRSENLVGKILSPIFWTLSKALMEVKVSGTLKEPKWSYVGLIDRITGEWPFERKSGVRGSAEFFPQHDSSGIGRECL